MSDTTTPEPVIFDSPGFPPDTRLIACGFPFHVNSDILKLCSRFFRTFMDHDQGRKDSGSNGHSAFRYEYTVTGGPDGISGLEPLHKVRCPCLTTVVDRPIIWVVPEKMS